MKRVFPLHGTDCWVCVRPAVRLVYSGWSRYVEHEDGRRCPLPNPPAAELPEIKESA